MTKTKIGVLGAGTWGTALARMLAGNGCGRYHVERPAR